MAATKHSMEEAIAIQRDFEQRFSLSGHVGVGIGLNRRRDDLALVVQLTRADDAAKLPETFGDLDVVVEIVGAVRAF